MQAFNSVDEALRALRMYLGLAEPRKVTKRAKKDVSSPIAPEDFWRVFLAYATCHRAAMEKRLPELASEAFEQLGVDWSASEAIFWGNEKILFVWDLVCFVITGASDGSLVAPVVEALDSVEHGAVVRLVAMRLADKWPEHALKPLVQCIGDDNRLNPAFASVLNELAPKRATQWCPLVLQWLEQSQWSLVSVVMRDLPVLAKFCVPNAAQWVSSQSLKSLPELPDVWRDCVVQVLSQGASDQLLSALCLDRADVRLVRDRLEAIHVPASPHAFLSLWNNHSSAREWLLQSLQQSRCGVGYGIMLLSKVFEVFDIETAPLLEYLWKLVPNSHVMQVLDKCLKDADTCQGALQWIVFVCGQPWRRLDRSWPIGTLLQLARANNDAGVTAAVEAVLQRGVTVEEAKEIAAAGSNGFDFDAMERALKCIALHGGWEPLCFHLMDVLVSSQVDHVFRAPVMGIPASRADVPLPLDQNSKSDLQYSNKLTVPLFPQNLTLRRGLSKPPAPPRARAKPVDLAAITANCQNLASLFSRVWRTTPSVGLALHLARQLEQTSVPLFLHHAQFDRLAYAATLPRTHLSRSTEDAFVAALFAQNPVLYSLLESLASIPLASSHCNRLISALLCHWIGQCYTQRVRKRTLEFPPEAWILFRFLENTQMLPHPMDEFAALIPFATAAEFSQVLLACWKYCEWFPPLDSEFDARCKMRTFPDSSSEVMEELLLPFRVCIADHLDQAAPLGLASLFGKR